MRPKLPRKVRDHITTVYYIFRRPLSQNPPSALKNADFVFAFVRQLLLLLFFENGQLYPFDDFCVAHLYYFVNIIL